VDATKEKRHSIRGARPDQRSLYAYGPERDRHDEVWSPESRSAVVAILESLSIPARIYAKNLIMKKALELVAERSLKSVTHREVEEGWQRTRAELGLEV